MMRSERGLSEVERTWARRTGGWGDAAGLLPIAVALALWVIVVIGIAAPLGDAVARLDARSQPPPDCATPSNAIASATPAPPVVACR